MTRTELPWLLWGRLVRPFPLAASLACADLAVLIVTGSSVWGDTRDLWSVAVAALCVLAVVLLWAAWWGRSSALMSHGLLLVAAIFTMRSVYVWRVGDNFWTAGIGFSIALAAAGAYLLERSTGTWDVRVGRRE